MASIQHVTLWIGLATELRWCAKKKREENLTTEQENANQPDQQREINPETMEHSGELWDQIRWVKLHIPHLREGKESGWQSVFEEIKAETFPHLTRSNK